jgi:hypothetical protein
MYPTMSQTLTITAKKFFSKNEDALIQCRNWAIYYMTFPEDLKEFNNSLNSASYEMMYDSK